MPTERIVPVRLDESDAEHLMDALIHKKICTEQYETMTAVALIHDEEKNSWETLYEYGLPRSFFGWMRYMIPAHIIDTFLCFRERTIIEKSKKWFKTTLETVRAPSLLTIELVVDLSHQDHIHMMVTRCILDLQPRIAAARFIGTIETRVLDQMEHQVRHILGLC